METNRGKTMTSAQELAGEDPVVRAGLYVWEFAHGEWARIKNPILLDEEDKDDCITPLGNYGYNPTLCHFDYDWDLEVWTAPRGSYHPYVVRTIVAGKEELIFPRDTPSLVELWIDLSLVLGLKTNDRIKNNL